MNLRLLALCGLAIVSSAAFTGCKNVKMEISTSYTDTPPTTSKEKSTSADSDKPQVQTTEESIIENSTDANNPVSFSESEASEETAYNEIENTTETGNKSTGEYSYSTILDSIYYMIVNNMDHSENVDGTVGIREAIIGCDNTWEALNAIGYSIQDLSGDGIPELVFGSNLDNYNAILAVYSCAGGDISLTFYGSVRSCYKMLGDGKFYYHGSGGAAYSYMGKYHLSDDGKYLITDYAYFTEPDPDDYSIINIYHTTSDSWDISEAELMENMTIDEFADASEDLNCMTVKMDLIPLSDYTPTE